MGGGGRIGAGDWVLATVGGGKGGQPTGRLGVEVIS